MPSPKDVTASKTPSINTLVEDIYAVFDKPQSVDPKAAEHFGVRLAKMLVDRITERKERATLRLSNLGKPCLRQLWYSINTPELGEKLSGPTRIKFLIGDITEYVVLFLAELAGHKVEYKQEKVTVYGVDGHIDALVDDELVDVKSASPYSFDNFKAGLRPEDDSFGYLGQLGGYAHALGRHRAHFIPVNKVLGTLHLDTHDLPEVDYEQRITSVRAALASNTPPERGFEDVPDGKSGNRKLGVNCSYCEFKSICWPGLAVIPYANGPRFLTKIMRQPKPRDTTG